MRLLPIFMLVVASGCASQVRFQRPVETRHITRNEIRTAKEFFGEATDLSHVELRFTTPRNDGRSAMAEPLIRHQDSSAHKGYSLTFFGPKMIRDFAAGPDSLFTDFMHEMTHVWQLQQKDSTDTDEHRNKNDRKYFYRLNVASSFDRDFGIEQQAAIIEDYAARFLMEKPQAAFFNKKKDTATQDALLQKVVEEKFPGAVKLREKGAAKRPVKPQQQKAPGNGL